MSATESPPVEGNIDPEFAEIVGPVKAKYDRLAKERGELTAQIVKLDQGISKCKRLLRAVGYEVVTAGPKPSPNGARRAPSYQRKYVAEETMAAVLEAMGTDRDWTVRELGEVVSLSDGAIRQAMANAREAGTVRVAGTRKEKEDGGHFPVPPQTFRRVGVVE